MKKLMVSVIATASIFTLAACNDNGDDSDVVAETESGNVTKDAFYNELKDRYGEEVLKEMVTKEVLNDKYDVSDKQVDKEVKKVKDKLGDQFEMALQQQGIKDEEAFRDMIRMSLLQEAAISEDVEISDKELKTKYERMQTEVKAKHILVEKEEKAKEIKKKLDNGADFSELAKEESTDKGTAEKGGDVGYFSTGKMTPVFEDKAYSMEAGEISEPVKSQFGWHIIKVTDKRKKEEDIGSFKENKDDIRREILNQKMDPAKAREKIDKLLKDAKIDIKAEGLEDIFKQDEQKAQG